MDKEIKKYFKKHKLNIHNLFVNEDESNFFVAADYVDFENQVYVSLSVLSVDYLEMSNFLEYVKFMKEAWQEKNYIRHLGMVHRRFYGYYLDELYNILWDLKGYELTKETWWDLFEHLWIDSEYLDTTDEIIEMFAANPHVEKHREKLKDKLNDEGKLEIYRGETSKSTSYKNGGISWTISKDKAEWFAKRFNSNGCVYKLEVNLEDVLAFLECRDEDEIIIDSSEFEAVRI